ncbi:MAG: cbb3-type cytochrome c oxidase subunit I [Actinobacteria bacterium]|nr:cbb3-type cytochrome c oxidase subunit I [Actinomycetota bacterium]
MALTDNSVVDALPAESESVPRELPTQAEPTGLAGVVGTADHKVIGRMWIAFSLIFGLATFVAATISAAGQLSGATFPGAQNEFQVFTIARIGMVFLFLVPLFIGIATVVCPLQVGARTVAFPRAAAAAFWAWLVGAVVLITAYASDGGIGGKLNPDGSVNKAIDLAFVGFGMVILAVLLASVCIATTIITLRPPGMDFFRVPLFSWSMVIATSAWVLTLPVVLGNLVLADLDYRSAAGATLGQQLVQWQQIAWVFGQPQIFAFAIPALGIMCELVATFSKARQPQRGALMGAIGAFGLFSLGAWAQAFFYNDLYNQIVFIALSIVLGLPILVLAGGWVTAVRQGALRPGGPFLLGVVSILMLLLGWVGAIAFVIKPFQLHGLSADTPRNLASFTKTLWTPTYPAAQVGLTGIVVLAATAAAFAALFYWSAKITGRSASQGWALLVTLVMLLATVMYGPPFIAFGFGNKSPDIDGSIDTISTISTIGAGLAAVAVVIVVLALLNGALSRKRAADDPWGSGQTLEWLTASPPRQGNFAHLDEVSSAEPVYDLRGDPSTETDEEAS